MVRVMQLYSFFFLIYYEFWPSMVRMYITPLFTSFMLSFHILDQSQYYEIVQSKINVRWFCIYFMAAMIGFYFIVLIITGIRKLVYRLEIIYTRVIWYKWLFWLCELVMLPALFNVIWLGNC